MDEQGSWMNDLTGKKETLKIADGETVHFVFKNNGEKKPSQEYGDSIRFKVQLVGEESVKYFYVKSKNFSLLQDIKEIAKTHNASLIDVRVQVSRVGSKKSDTKYSIKII